MQRVRNGSRLGYWGYDECSGYGKGQAWVTEDMINAVGMEWPRLGYQGYDECSGYGMGHAWVTEDMMNAVGMEWLRLGYQGYDECSGYRMGHAWGYGGYDKCSGYGKATPGLPRIWWMQRVRNGSRLGYWGDVRGEMYTLWYTFPFMFCTFHTVGHLWLSLSRYANNIHSVKSVAFRSRLCDINKPCT